MISPNLTALVERMNTTCKAALEAAAGLCVTRQNYHVEIEHWLLRLIEADGTDIGSIFAQYGVDHTRLVADMVRAIDRLRIGNTRTPTLSPDLADMARDAWNLASLDLGATEIRSGHLLLSLLLDDARVRLAREVSNEFQKIKVDELVPNFAKLTASSSEAKDAPKTEQGAVASTSPTSGSALERFTVDMTAAARTGAMDPVVGRETEIRQLIDILMRRRQNNPILTGEAGVGKTAVVEGFAQRVANGEVPPPLQGIAVRSLDIGLLQAGASVKGEFERRLRGVIDETKAATTPIVLFIDEAHMLIGAGGQAGQGDAANLLKPALARGELRTIAATTWAEYKKYFEKDPALTRRFQVVKVEEPDEDTAVAMMRGLVVSLEKHHQIRVMEEAVTAAVQLGSRYLSGRFLPDKSVSLLDTACARVAVGLNDVPPVIEDLRSQIAQLGVRLEILGRETAIGEAHAEEIASLTAHRSEIQAALEAAESRWKSEVDLVTQLNALREELGQAATADQGVEAQAELPSGKRAELDRLSEELEQIQGDTPIVASCVDKFAVAEVVASWTGIPVGRMVADEVNTVLELKDRMAARIVGQDHALETIAQSIRSARADLVDPSKPVGVFLLAGPSGVGKTETALTLAELLFGGEQNLTVINMSEFKEEHKVSLLMGSPPGYVGYGEGGVLTEAVRRKPYSVVLLDEVEKAHPGVQDIFYQVFDKGSLRDGEGRDIDFRNTVLIMTSNAASGEISAMCADPTTAPDVDTLATAIRPTLLETFKPAFLGRTTLVPYLPLAGDILERIIRLKLDKVVRRVAERYQADLVYKDSVPETILARCTEVESGARNIDNIVSRGLLPDLAAHFLGRLAAGETVQRVEIDVDQAGAFAYRLESAE